MSGGRENSLPLATLHSAAHPPLSTHLAILRSAYHNKNTSFHFQDREFRCIVGGIFRGDTLPLPHVINVKNANRALFAQMSGVCEIFFLTVPSDPTGQCQVTGLSPTTPKNVSAPSSKPPVKPRRPDDTAADRDPPHAPQKKTPPLPHLHRRQIPK